MKFHFKPTLACNLHCDYCNEKNMPGIQLGLSVALGIIDKISGAAAITKSRRVEFEWSGGEPLLLGPNYYKSVFEHQAYRFQSKKVKNVIYSNILLLTPQFADILSEFNVEIYTSLDDLGANSLRNNSGSSYFEEFRENLNLLLARQIRVKLYSTVTSQNVKNLKEVYWFAKDCGIDYDFANVQRPYTNGSDVFPIIAPDVDDFYSASIDLFEDWYNNPSINTTIKPFFSVIQYLVTGMRQIPTALISFDPYGNLYTCPYDISKKSRVSPISEFDSKILAGLSTNKCSNDLSANPACADCLFCNFCNWMLCKETTERTEAFRYTCAYWKPVFHYIYDKLENDLRRE